MKNLIIPILIVLHFNPLSQAKFTSSNNPIDSIYQLLEKTNSVEDDIKLYIKLIDKSIDINHPDKLKYIEELSQYSLNNNSTFGIATAKSFNAYNLITSGMPHEAIPIFEEALSLFQTIGSEKEIIKSNIYLSICYERLGNKEKALGIIKDLSSTIEESSEASSKYLFYKRQGELHGILLAEKEKGIEYLDKAMKFATSSDLNETLENKTRVLLSKGTILLNYDNQRAAAALSTAEELAIKSNNQSILVYIRNLLIFIAHRDGRFSDAITIASKNLDMAEKHNDLSMIVESHNSLGSLNVELGNKDKATEHYTKAVNLSKNTNLTLSYVGAIGGLGHMHSIQNESAKAIELLEEALLISDSLNLTHYIIEILPIIGVAYLDIEQIEKGKNCFEKSLEMIQGTNENHLITSNKGLGIYHIIKENWDKSEGYLQKAYQVSISSNNSIEKAEIALLLSQVYYGKSDYKSALKWKNEHYQFRDSLNLVENQEKLTTLRLSSEFEKEKEVIALKNEQEKVLLNAKQERTSLLGLIALLTALSAFALYYISRRKNKQIQEQKNNLEELNNVKDTLFQIIGHDLKKPSLNFRNVSKNINYLLEKEDYKRLQSLGEEVDQDAKSLYNLTDNLLNWALTQKDTIRIRPKSININEIVNYNIDLFKSIAARKNIKLINNVNTNTMAKVDQNSFDTIIRNLIDNAIKYTPINGKITIASSETDGLINLYIKDTGVGIEKSTLDSINNESNTYASRKGTDGEKGSGIGLHLVKTLLTKNNGKLILASNYTTGIVAQISLPKAG